MRLNAKGTDKDKKTIKQFSEWLFKVGEGKVGHLQDGFAEIQMPDNILIKDTLNPLHSIVECTYPDLLNHLLDSKYFTERAILAPTMAIVDEINDYILSLIPQESVNYYSSDTICKTDDDNNAAEELYDIEFLNTINCSGIPPHNLQLKLEFR